MRTDANITCVHKQICAHDSRRYHMSPHTNMRVIDAILLIVCPHAQCVCPYAWFTCVLMRPIRLSSTSTVHESSRKYAGDRCYSPYRASSRTKCMCPHGLSPTLSASILTHTLHEDTPLCMRTHRLSPTKHLHVSSHSLHGDTCTPLREEALSIYHRPDRCDGPRLNTSVTK